MDQIFTLLELAREKYEAVVDRENELNDKVARLDKMIAELKKEPVAPTRFVKLFYRNQKRTHKSVYVDYQLGPGANGATGGEAAQPASVQAGQGLGQSKVRSRVGGASHAIRDLGDFPNPTCVGLFPWPTL